MRGGARLIPKGSSDNCVFLLSCPWSVCDTSITSVTNRCGSLLIVPSQHPAVIVADAVLTMAFRACQGNIISTYMTLTLHLPHHSFFVSQGLIIEPRVSTYSVMLYVIFFIHLVHGLGPYSELQTLLLLVLY